LNSTRSTSIATGALLILATFAAVAASAVQPGLTGPSYLADVANHPNRLAAAALLYLIAAGTSVGISIALYPMLKKINGALALGSVVSRTIEAVFYTVAVVSLLSILPLGQQLNNAAADQTPALQAMAGSFVSVRDKSNVVAIFAFNLGALTYYALFYRSRLVPRWLSGWGVVAAMLMMTACMLALFDNRPVTGYTLLILPIALQEMVLAVWLLVKGFSSPNPTDESISRSSTQLVGLLAD
jgi:hypothetical protein